MFVSLLLLALAAVASARKCQNITVPVSLSARNGVFDVDLPVTAIDSTNFMLEIARQGVNYSATIATGYATVKGNYKLKATYCEPDHGPGKVLQVLTHGIGFDRTYWDLPFNNYNYSYVARATDDHGYSTLAWDRLGVGESSRGDPLAEIQVDLEIAALKKLTDLLHAGKVCDVKKPYHKIVHVGHSYGSVITYTMANMYPHSTAGIALTGFSQVGSYLGEFALGGNFIPVSEIPSLAHKYGLGYLGASSAVGVQINFLAPGGFDPKILDVAVELGQPFAVGEILTVGGGTPITSVYSGPVLIITGDNDIPFCGGNCMGTTSVNGGVPNLLDVSAQFFPKASPFNTTVVPGTGHGMNLHYTHPVTYGTLLEFFNSNV